MKMITVNPKNSAPRNVASTRSLLMLSLMTALSVTMRSFLETLSETTAAEWGLFSQPVPSRALDGIDPMENGQGGQLYTLVVVRCRGDMEWLNDVPSDWRIVVYEKCLKHPSAITNYSVTTAVRGQPEECNGYLDYIYDNYYNLTMATIFFHEDGLIPYTKRHRSQAIKAGREWYHTGFYNFSEVVAATKEYLTPQQNFLHFGTGTLRDFFGRDIYHGEAQKILWPYLRTEKSPLPPTQIVYKPSAHMAVRKEAILARSRETYGALLQQARYSKDVGSWKDSRQICCAMERMWHILFGQPPALPESAMVYNLLKKRKL